MAQFQFSTAGIDLDESGTNDRKPVPEGTYTAVIIESDYRQNKAKTGHFLKLKFEITKGEHEGRYVWENLNVDHPKEDTEKYAKRDLARIATICGHDDFEDTEVLHYKPIDIYVKVREASNGFDPSNTVNGYSAPAGSAPPPPAAPVAQAAPAVEAPAPAPAADAGKKPWDK